MSQRRRAVRPQSQAPLLLALACLVLSPPAAELKGVSRGGAVGAPQPRNSALTLGLRGGCVQSAVRGSCCASLLRLRLLPLARLPNVALLAPVVWRAGRRAARRPRPVPTT